MHLACGQDITAVVWLPLPGKPWAMETAITLSHWEWKEEEEEAMEEEIMVT